MPSMVQDAIGQQMSQYPGGATISAAPPEITSPMAGGYAYQQDLPRWMQNAIWASQLPARGMAWGGALPMEAYHMVATPMFRSLFTGSPFAPGQAPSWIPQGFQPRTDPASNVMRSAADKARWVSEVATGPYLAPETWVAGRGMKPWKPEPPTPTSRGTTHEPPPLRDPSPPEEIIGSRAGYEVRRMAHVEHAENLKRLQDIAAYNKRAKMLGQPEQWSEFNRVLKSDPAVWNVLKKGQQERVRNFADQKTLEAEAQRWAQEAVASGRIRTRDQLMQGLEKHMEQWYEAAVKRALPENRPPTKFRSFVKPGQQ